MQIVLFGNSGTQLETSISRKLERYASSSDTFYFQITANSPQYEPTTNYDLYLSVILLLDPDSYENDNTLAEAKMLLIDSTVQQRTLTPHDTDWALINLSSEGKLIINVSHATDNYNTLYLYDSDYELLAVNSAYSGGTSLMYAFETGGTYYCQIKVYRMRIFHTA